MSTTAELRAHYATAGAAYAAAFTAFKNAWVSLRAHEIALCNSKVCAEANMPSTGAQPDIVALSHPTFLPLPGATIGTSNWADLANAQARTLIANWPTPDE
jgi:hypothetical protein